MASGSTLFDHLNHIHIWQVSHQPRSGDTCQMWIWYSQCFLIILKHVRKLWKEEICVVTSTPAPLHHHDIKCHDFHHVRWAYFCFPEGRFQQLYHISVKVWYRWLSATLQYLQCISTGDTAVSHKAIDIKCKYIFMSAWNKSAGNEFKWGMPLVMWNNAPSHTSGHDSLIWWLCARLITALLTIWSYHSLAQSHHSDIQTWW